MTPQAHRRYVPPAVPPRESHWRTWLVGGVALVLWFYFLLYQLPALVS